MVTCLLYNTLLYFHFNWCVQIELEKSWIRPVCLCFQKKLQWELLVDIEQKMSKVKSAYVWQESHSSQSPNRLNSYCIISAIAAAVGPPWTDQVDLLVDKTCTVGPEKIFFPFMMPRNFWNFHWHGCTESQVAPINEWACILKGPDCIFSLWDSSLFLKFIKGQELVHLRKNSRVVTRAHSQSSHEALLHAKWAHTRNFLSR